MVETSEGVDETDVDGFVAVGGREDTITGALVGESVGVNDDLTDGLLLETIGDRDGMATGTLEGI